MNRSEEGQSGGDPVSRASIRHALDAQYADLLATVKLFAGLKRVTLAKLAAHLESVAVPSGGVLFRAGEPGDAFYLVARGSFGAYVTSGDEGAERRINSVRAGDPLGELALLGGHPRTATIRADTDAEVLRLERGRFLALVREEPTVALAVAAALAERLRERDAPAPAASGGVASVTPAKSAPAAPVAATKRRVSAKAVGMALAVVLLAAGWTMTPPSGLSAQGWHAVVSTVAFIPLLATDALPDGVAALLLGSLWVLGGVASPALAFSGFGSSSWVLLVSVLIIGAAIASSGLLYRMALWMVTHSRGGFVGQVSALCAAGLVLSPAVPNATARLTLVAPAIGELIEALGYTPRSRPAAGLAMATFVGCGQMVAPFLTSSTTAVLVFAILSQTGAVQLDFVSWALYAAPANAIVFLGMVAALLWFYRPRGQADAATAPHRETLRLQRKLIGPPTRAERASFALGAAMLAGFVTQPFHGVNPAWVAALGLGAFGVMRLVDNTILSGVNWSFVLLFGILMSLSNVFEATGVDRWLGGSVRGVLGSLAEERVLFVAALTLLAYATSFLLRWQANAPLLTVIVSPMALAAGIHPFVVGLVALMASNVFFLPYQSTGYLALYHGTGGRIFTHRQARPAALAYAVITLVALCASVGPWRMMGLL